MNPVCTSQSSITLLLLPCKISKENNLSSLYFEANWRFHKIELLYISKMQKMKSNVQRFCWLSHALVTRQLSSDYFIGEGNCILFFFWGGTIDSWNNWEIGAGKLRKNIIMILILIKFYLFLLLVFKIMAIQRKSTINLILL